MANENDNIKQEGAEHPEEHQHRSLMDRLGESFEKLNTEFPLSGGETNEDLESVDDSEEDEATAETNKEPQADAEPHEHHSIMGRLIEKIQKLDTEFPLSGGETNEDLENVDDEEEEEQK